MQTEPTSTNGHSVPHALQPPPATEKFCQACGDRSGQCPCQLPKPKLDWQTVSGICSRCTLPEPLTAVRGAVWHIGKTGYHGVMTISDKKQVFQQPNGDGYTTEVEARLVVEAAMRDYLAGVLADLM